LSDLEQHYTHLESDGGGEGGAEDCYGVFQLKDTIFRVEWKYYSHHGTYADCSYSSLAIVVPKQVTVTQYVVKWK
jgi:hypothetical protein